jgi:phosphoglycolate phosphatase
MRYQYVFLDLDGTIMQTHPGLVNGLRYAQEQLNLPELPLERRDLYIGPSLHHFAATTLGMNRQQADEMIAVFRKYYAEKGVRECAPFPGMLELMSTLRRAGAKVYVCTSKPTGPATTIARQFHFDVDGIEGAGTDAMEKTEILSRLIERLGCNPADCVMVGDRYTDLEGGKICKTHTVGVRFGYAAPGELEGCEPDYIAENAQDLLDYLMGDADD